MKEFHFTDFLVRQKDLQIYKVFNPSIEIYWFRKPETLSSPSLPF